LHLSRKALGKDNLVRGAWKDGSIMDLSREKHKNGGSKKRDINKQSERSGSHKVHQQRGINLARTTPKESLREEKGGE